MEKMSMSSDVQMLENLHLLTELLKKLRVKRILLQPLIFLEQHLILLKFLLDDGKALIDSPGIINHHQMAHFVDKRDLKIITPKKEIKPKVFQLNEGQTLFFGGLARFDYISGGQKIICLSCFE